MESGIGRQTKIKEKLEKNGGKKEGVGLR